MKKYNIAIVGATGMVGQKLLEVLAERKLPVENYYLYASAKSAGSIVTFMGKEHTIIELTERNIIDKKIDIALFSAGGATSEAYAQYFVQIGATVIDNSSAFRMDKDVPLVVPEVNPEDVLWNKGIISNPNCSTIQAVVALKPLYDRYGIKRIVYSTYQAVSGAGVGGYNDLLNGANGVAPTKFPHAIFGNCIPHIDSFTESGYTKEEIKMVKETQKILHDDSLKVTATTVRVPVRHGHSESINIEFKKPCTTLSDLRETLKNGKGIIVQDDTSMLEYPMPLTAENRDEVFVGRIRLDDTVDSGCNIWVVSDNIRKGAATNAVQIAELLMGIVK